MHDVVVIGDGPTVMYADRSTIAAAHGTTCGRLQHYYRSALASKFRDEDGFLYVAYHIDGTIVGQEVSTVSRPSTCLHRGVCADMRTGMCMDACIGACVRVCVRGL